MGLFDKKICDICGEKIGLLGGQTLTDGLLCADCAAKLSPYFTLQGSHSVEDIREQLALREENREKLQNFQPNKCFGVGAQMFIDEKQGSFVIASNQNFTAENPDLFSLADITGARLDIPQSRQELYRRDFNGNRVPYNPRRYSYAYDFYIYITLDHPYARELKLKLNRSTVDGADRMSCQKLKEDGEAIVKYLRLRHLQQEHKAARGPVLCPYCGATTMPDEKGCCEYCGSKVG